MTPNHKNASPESTRLPSSPLLAGHALRHDQPATGEPTAGAFVRVVVNGQSVTIPSGSTVADVLEQQGVRTDLVAVEVNLEIVPKQTHHQTVLSEGDQLEVVTLVGGG